MKLGGEQKKVAILGVLVAVGGYVFYANVLSGPETPQAPSKSTPKQGAAVKGAAPLPNIRRAKTPVRGSASAEFKPTLKPEEQPNYAAIDPTLRLDLLAKVQSASPEGGTRSLFQFAAAPPPEAVTVAVIKPAPRRYGPELPPKAASAPAPAPPPPPPPITLKFYGFSKPKPDGDKRAFFMDGEEIYIAAEGELVKKRYRVVKIDANSVVMEDTQFKNNRQTLVIQPEQAS
jgi:hypothetical protein